MRPDARRAKTCDTPLTPVPKSGCHAGWLQGAGDLYPGADACGYIPGSSPTPGTVDFFAVRFHDAFHGLAGGAGCSDAAVKTLAGCPMPEQVPVLYQYTNLPGQGPLWQKVALPGADRRGYVAAIAYISADHILAVGGDGYYPRRELARASGEDDASYAARDAAGVEPNAAGHARAWLYSNGNWCEVGHGCAALPAGMAALTALDCTPRPHVDGELCLAGGVRQLWTWRNGRFAGAPDTPTSTDASGQPTVDRGSEWRFRVRAIRFVPGPTPPAVTQAVAVTSGCCASLEAQNAARVLVFDGTRWHVQLLYEHNAFTEENAQSLPDSYLSVYASDGGGAPYASVIAAPGGPQTSTEAYSRVMGAAALPGQYNAPQGSLTPAASPVTATGDPIVLIETAIALPLNAAAGGPTTFDNTDVPFEATSPTSYTVRLVSGDGDLQGPPAIGSTQPTEGPDGLIDWAVGALTSGPQSGQGLAFTTTAQMQGAARLTPEALQCPGGSELSVSTSCSPSSAAQLSDSLRSHGIYVVSSFALNSFTMVAGGGWAVGDRGAIVRLGGDAQAGAVAEPKPPQLGSAQSAPLPDSSPYAAFAPAVTSQPGAVPALAAQPLIHLAAPQWLPAGSPDESRSVTDPLQDVGTMVFSRDGSEGWALGAPRMTPGITEATTLYRYAGSTWTECQPDPLPGQPADAACAGLEPLYHYINSLHEYAPVVWTAAARVPTEDGPQSGEPPGFEMIAFGSAYTAPGGQEAYAVARYRAGRWSMDADAMRQIGIPQGGTVAPTSAAFTAPDDGWLLLTNRSGGSDYGLYHYDGRGWTSCAAHPAACGDVPSASRLPSQVGSLTLTSVGRRVYLYGQRLNGSSTTSAANTGWPLIIYRDPGGHWTDGQGADGAGYDPGCASFAGGHCVASPSTSAGQTLVTALSVAAGADGGLRGWAAGSFSAGGQAVSLLRLLPGRGWAPWTVPDASRDYAGLLGSGSVLGPTLALSAFGGAGGERSLLLPAVAPPEYQAPRGPVLVFDDRAQRWRTSETPFALNMDHTPADAQAPGQVGLIRAVAADGAGGGWVAVRRFGFGNLFSAREHMSTFFYHYTDVAPKPVFTDAPHPIRRRITGLAAAPDGSVWVATDSSEVFRYDRVGGWSQLRIPGWDPGRITTAASPANGVAVGPDGSGLVVGKGGRMADVSASGAVLDAASGVLCSAHPELLGAGSCGTSRDLYAAAVAPDGSALAGGDDGALLWRPAGGGFRTLPRPPVATTARITGLSLPAPGRAWLVTSTGDLLGGTLGSGGWSWQREAVPGGVSLTDKGDGSGEAWGLNGVAIDASGQGLAVGDGGLLLERRADGSWSRVAGLPWDRFHSVTLAPGGLTQGALIGGQYGLVLTLSDGRFQVAHQADPYDPVNTTINDTSSSAVVGVAIVPGFQPGQVEAWAAEQVLPDYAERNRSPEPGALLHYASDPSDRLLNDGQHVAPLPDTPPAAPGDLTFAAFGKQECAAAGSGNVCPEPTGTSRFNEVVARRVADEIGAPGSGSAFALFTGDAVDAAGQGGTLAGTPIDAGLPTDPSVMHDRWVDQVAQRFDGESVPLFGAIGQQDLAEARACSTPPGMCAHTGGAAVNVGWRTALSGMPAPWGAAGAPSEGSSRYEFRPLPDGSPEAPGSGARTHYAFDVVERASSRAAARVVVVDTSQGTLAGADALQNPVENQIAWLRSMLCFAGHDQTPADHCSRPAGEPAIVVSEAPTYSYGPGANKTLADATTFEALLMQYRVSVLVSGRLGWNGMYWATAPGLHEPCPGGSYPDPSAVPAPGASNCAGASSGVPAAQSAMAPVATAVGGAAPAAAPVLAQAGAAGGALGGILPVVVAASAGGRFGPDGTSSGTAAQGFWHGYTIVRLPAGGDPAKLRVIQRPVLDWITITAPEHTLHPGQHETLDGIGREPVGSDAPISYDDISGFAITHRYDLVEADPQRPWLPKVDPASPLPNHYVALDPSVGGVDPVTGKVTTGRGNHGRVYALAILSVGDKAAAWPLVFEPRRSYVPPPASVLPAPPVVPPIHVAAVAAAAPPPSPPALSPPQIGQISFPSLPGLPSLPAVASAPPPAPVPPATPPAPPPPAFGGQPPLSLTVSLSQLSNPPSPIPSSAPVVNPAPPSGSAAKKEARQRQAATAKSEEGASGDAQEAGGDLVQGRPGPNGISDMTRSGVDRERLAFTALPAGSAHPSAWPRELLYVGAITVMALLLGALSTVYPTPRRRARRRVAAAPVWVREGRRR